MEVENDDCVTMVQLAIQKCLEKEALCNEFYLQLIKQTTDQPGSHTFSPIAEHAQTRVTKLDHFDQNSFSYLLCVHT